MFCDFLSETLNFYRVSLVQLFCFSFGRICCHLSTIDGTVYSGIPGTNLKMILRISIGKSGFLSESQDFYRKAWISIGWHPYKLYDLVFIDMFSLSARELQQALLFMKSIMFSDFLSEPFNFHRIVFSSDHDYYLSDSEFSSYVVSLS